MPTSLIRTFSRLRAVPRCYFGATTLQQPATGQKSGTGVTGFVGSINCPILAPIPLANVLGRQCREA
jgi:hypothetical protein